MSLTDNQSLWLSDLRALEKKISQANKHLDDLKHQHKVMLNQQAWAKGPYKPVHLKKDSYYNQTVERLDSNWKGKEHIGY